MFPHLVLNLELKKKKFFTEKTNSALLSSYYKIQGSGLIRSVKCCTLRLAQGSFHMTLPRIWHIPNATSVAALLLLLDISQGFP